MGGGGPIQCLRIADVLDLECSLALSPGPCMFLSHVGGVTAICLALPMVDNVFLLLSGDLVFGVHQQ